MKVEDLGAVSVLDHNNTPACMQDTLPQQPTVAERSRAEVLAVFNRYDTRDSGVIEAMTSELRAVVDPCSPQGLAVLHQHLPLIEALFLHLLHMAHEARTAKDKEKLSLASLQAHQALLRSTALLRAMGGPGSPSVVLERP